jgi:hypothetical protein
VKASQGVVYKRPAYRRGCNVTSNYTIGYYATEQLAWKGVKAKNV